MRQSDHTEPSAVEQDARNAARLRLAANQSSYLPWKGYFDIIHDADLFFFYDDVKYTKKDWRNRNMVKGKGAPRWITIPIERDAVYQRICDVRISSAHWQLKHWRTLMSCYGKSRYFPQYAPYFEDFYLRHRWTHLSEMNQMLIRQICEWLGIQARFGDSRELGLTGVKQDRVLDLIEKTGATCYVVGPAAQSYLDPREFARRNVALKFKAYDYPEYWQGDDQFTHNVSIVDLLFRFGPQATQYIWGSAKHE